MSDAPDGFVAVASVGDIPAGGMKCVAIDRDRVLLAHIDGRFYAISDICSHAEVSLSEGEVYDDTIECWLHGSCFDLRTGRTTNPPATEPIATYQVRVEDGTVFVALDPDD